MQDDNRGPEGFPQLRCRCGSTQFAANLGELEVEGNPDEHIVFVWCAVCTRKAPVVIVAGSAFWPKPVEGS